MTIDSLGRNWTSSWNIYVISLKKNSSCTWPGQTYHWKNELQIIRFLSFPLKCSQTAAETKNGVYFQAKIEFFLIFSKLNLLNTEQLMYGFVSFFYTIKHAHKSYACGLHLSFRFFTLCFWYHFLCVFKSIFFHMKNYILYFYYTFHLDVFSFTFFVLLIMCHFIKVHSQSWQFL